MKLTLGQRDAIVDALFDTIPGMNAISSMAFLIRLEEILDLMPENAAQREVYSKAKEYEYILKELHKLNHKVQAIKFMRQMTQSGLYDVKKVVDHFWSNFDGSA